MDWPRRSGPGTGLPLVSALFKVADAKGGKGLGSGGNFVLKSGMVYSISPTVVANGGEEAVLSGTSLVVTENGQRELGNRKLELLVAS